MLGGPVIETKLKTLVSETLITTVASNKSQGIQWIKMKSPGDDYSCHIEYNSTYKVTFENRKINV